MSCREGAQQSSAGPEALALMTVTQPAAPSSTEGTLPAEVAALKGLLAHVTPQLQELTGMKQQMGQLLTLLQPGIAGDTQLLPVTYLLNTHLSVMKSVISISGKLRLGHTQI